MWTGFKKEAFELLERYKQNDDFKNYKKEEYDPLIRDQFKEIKDFVFPLLNSLLPSYNLTDKYALAKHASQGNTLYHHFWGAIYRSSKESKSKDVQLFWRIDPTRFSFGLYFGFDVEKELLQECQANIDRNSKKILSLFQSINSPRKLLCKIDDTHGFSKGMLSADEAFAPNALIDNSGINIYFNYEITEAVEKGVKLKEEILEGFTNIAELYKLIVGSDTQARYWGGGLGDDGDLDKWMKGDYWQLNFKKDDQSPAAKIAWDSFAEISVGDEFVMRGWGGRNDLVCHYYGKVIEKNENGLLRFEPLPERSKYHGKAPSGEGAGQWGRTINEVKRKEDIDLIFFGKQVLKPEAITMTKNDVDKFLFNNNVIFYGPPGTGKTYETIDRAVLIASGKKSSNHKENKILFDQLKKEKQIGFVTFHQNYSYEDFVIGLRPDTREENLRFYEKEGVFFEFSERARKNYEASKGKSKGTRTFDEVFDELISPLDKDEPIEVKMASGGSFKITGVSERTIYFDKQSEGSKHTLCIETLKELVNEERGAIVGLKAYYTPLVNMIREKMLQATQTNVEQIKNYVLIIDEINRANISKVFGELITLLEEDKRIDGENAMSVMLPNGKEFSVPSNLYIIGTMNTADKSIAFIDIALRRRFEFEGIYPKYDIDGLNKDKADFLRVLNKNIQAMKKSSDYLIGHAYFLNKNTIEDILKRKIIPLLMEYFSNKVEFVSDTFKGTGFVANYDEDNCSWVVKRG